MNPIANRERIGKLAGWAIGLTGAVLVAPVAYLAIKGMVGIAIAGVLGLACVHFAPWAGMKLANLGLSARKHEARANPIETMQMQAIAARKRLAQARTELTAFATEVRNFADEVRTLERSGHPEDAEQFQQQLAGMNRLLEQKTASLAKADKEADAFEIGIKRAQSKWKVAQSAIRINKLAGAKQDDAINEILQAESLGAVQSAMNQALAEMDMAIAQQA